MSNKINLSFLPQIFENYVKEQTKIRDDFSNSHLLYNYYDGKIQAADDLLENIKDFIKDANKLQGK